VDTYTRILAGLGSSKKTKAIVFRKGISSHFSCLPSSMIHLFVQNRNKENPANLSRGLAPLYLNPIVAYILAIPVVDSHRIASHRITSHLIATAQRQPQSWLPCLAENSTFPYLHYP
jgi:hypothetical protein